jgi:uncharacterized membrane protein
VTQRDEEKLKETDERSRFERRWPVALAIAASIAIHALLPGRIRLWPIWGPYLLGGAVLGATASVGLTRGRARWLHVERTVTLVFCVIVALLNLVTLANLIYLIAQKSAGTNGLQLLASSVMLWVVNTLTFSLAYWQMDRGGPDARVNHTGTRADWLFPQEGAPAEDVPPDWRPAFVDYLYLSYSTAVAFSTTDVMPLTARAKLLMMYESMISLATIVVVAARSINILES